MEGTDGCAVKDINGGSHLRLATEQSRAAERGF